MARYCQNSGSKYLSYSGSVVSGPPCTLACWVYPLNTTQDHCLLTLSSTLAVRHLAMYFHGSYSGGELGGNSDRAAFWADDGTVPGQAAYSSSPMVANRWQHVCGTTTATNDRKIYLNGIQGVNSTTSRNPSVNITGIGAVFYGSSTPSALATAYIAEAAIWNVSLSASEAASLAAGVCPLFVRPSALVSYWPLFGQHNPESDLVGRFNMTPNNSPTSAAHPRIIYPFPPSVFLGTAAVGSSIDLAGDWFGQSRVDGYSSIHANLLGYLSGRGKIDSTPQKSVIFPVNLDHRSDVLESFFSQTAVHGSLEGKGTTTLSPAVNATLSSQWSSVSEITSSCLLFCSLATSIQSQGSVESSLGCLLRLVANIPGGGDCLSSLARLCTLAGELEGKSDNEGVLARTAVLVALLDGQGDLTNSFSRQITLLGEMGNRSSQDIQIALLTGMATQWTSVGEWSAVLAGRLGLGLETESQGDLSSSVANRLFLNAGLDGQSDLSSSPIGQFLFGSSLAGKADQTGYPVLRSLMAADLASQADLSPLAGILRGFGLEVGGKSTLEGQAGLRFILACDLAGELAIEADTLRTVGMAFTWASQGELMVDVEVDSPARTSITLRVRGGVGGVSSVGGGTLTFRLPGGSASQGQTGGGDRTFRTGGGR